MVASIGDSVKQCKITLLQRLVCGGDFEPWLHFFIRDSEILPGYNIFRRDRSERGGGVLVAVKQDIQASRCFDLEREGVQLVVVELRNGHDQPNIPTRLLKQFKN